MRQHKSKTLTRNSPEGNEENHEGRLLGLICNQSLTAERATLWVNLTNLTHSALIQISSTVPSSVGRATRYGMDRPGIESRWRRDFPHPSRADLGPTLTSYPMGTVEFPGVKRPGRGDNHSLLSSAEVKERVQIHLYSTSGPSWPVLE
jgi:hypothetical protein